MENLANLDSFIRSAEFGSFSAAARRLSLTPAAVSRNVAILEKKLGIRLFQRSTRKLALTEAGERFLSEIRDHVEALQAAIVGAASQGPEPAGLLKVSMSPHFGADYILPLLPDFLARYPLIRPEWTFENRQVDLIAEGYDAAIGGGFELAAGTVARILGPAHVVAVASPRYMKDRRMPADPADLAGWDGIYLRSSNTGRIRQWVMPRIDGEEVQTSLSERIVMNDPAAMVRAARLGLGVSMITVPDALPHFRSGELIRLLPDWYADIGPISIYYANRTLLPAKTRVFVDFVTEHFRKEKLAERFDGRPRA
ncbi:LysR family transcriptional regulator [Rhizobium terrae]|uniref:LysR family transcriptional regulator n=1 Tax=Rhizobium terrae TaxID=2171756 RepID=UPI000E3E5584|nr:LysR family transcriptional regulator [Rhizobium terrae]